MVERPYLLTRIELYDPNKKLAYANVRYGLEKWFPVVLDMDSLTSLDLREGDTFRWIPQEDGIVKPEHILEHPRQADPDENKKTEQVFDSLEKLMCEKVKEERVE